MTPEDGSVPTLTYLTTNVIDVTTDVDAPSADVHVPDTPATEEEPERERQLVFELQGVEVKDIPVESIDRVDYFKGRTTY